MAQYGNDTVKVFGNLQAQAVATGVDVNSLAAVASKLDTFKGAAQAAQGFNAVLGKTVLSVTDLVHAEPAEKIELLKDAMDRSGMSFDTANRRVKSIIASMLGIDVAKASKLFGSEQDYFQLKNNLDGSSDSMEELEKRAEASMSVAEKMKASMSSLGKASSEAIDRARINAEKASETLMTVIGGLGEKAETAEEVLIALRTAITGVSVIEQRAEGLIAAGKNVAGWAAIGTLIYNNLSKPLADKVTRKISDVTGVSEETIRGTAAKGPGGKKAKTKPEPTAPATTPTTPAPAGAPATTVLGAPPPLPADLANLANPETNIINVYVDGILAAETAVENVVKGRTGAKPIPSVTATTDKP